MQQMTRANLEAAFAGESQAHMRYSIYADKAEKDGFPQAARLFRAAATAERIHATSHLRALGGIASTAENLKAAFEGETHEVEEMYPSFQAVADMQGEKAASRSMSWAFEAEKVHAALYDQARAAIEAGQDTTIGQVYVCNVCGWTGEGETPDECPLCKAKKDKFTTF